ncbi:MAG TPA: hypothetical protein VL371_04840, partial [Gemmataceae bacterium]|nr:hypothetical protein [Gemmataceae bacterium]
GRQISETYLRQLKDLADELRVGWRYAPLHVFLDEDLASRERERPEIGTLKLRSLTLPARQSLPVIPQE